jgi:hypothetical protein
LIFLNRCRLFIYSFSLFLANSLPLVYLQPFFSLFLATAMLSVYLPLFFSFILATVMPFVYLKSTVYICGYLLLYSFISAYFVAVCLSTVPFTPSLVFPRDVLTKIRTIKQGIIKMQTYI